MGIFVDTDFDVTDMGRYVDAITLTLETWVAFT